MDITLGLDEPEELEQKGMNLVREGSPREGLKLILRAAKGYEDIGRKEDAARLYRYLGYYLLERTGSIKKAKPTLIKSAYLYIDLIEEELSKPEINLEVLDEYCFNVLEVFAKIRDGRGLTKYAEEFAMMYEDLGSTYQNSNDILSAIRAYETAYRYYRIIDDVEDYRRIAEILITLHGQVAEDMLENGNSEGAAEEFYRLAKYTRTIFGYDIHFIEMMDTAAKNFEKASKVAYSQGDLDKTTELLVKAQYSYLIAKNFNRAKLIGLNAARMLYQVISSHRGRGDEKKASEKLMELSETLVGIGKFKEALEPYKSALDYGDLSFRVRIRLAAMKKQASAKSEEEILNDVDHIEYYLEKRKNDKALELAEEAMRKREDLAKMLREIHASEGYISL